MAIRFNPAQYDINFSFNLNDVPELVQRVSVAAAMLDLHRLARRGRRGWAKGFRDAGL